MLLTERQTQLFDTLVREYSRTGVPIASEALAREFLVSSATVRNDFLVLDEQGLTAQPHTSAGRIPTEKGYRSFIERNHPAVHDRKQRADLKPKLRSRDGEDAVKVLAKAMAELMEEAVMVGFGPHDVYYTGLSYVFAQPEFMELARVVSFSSLVDRIDEVMAKIFNRVVAEDAQVWLGKENPFGSECGTIVIRFETRDHDGVIGLLGPMRMDYEKGIGLVEYAQEVLRRL